MKQFFDTMIEKPMAFNWKDGEPPEIGLAWVGLILLIILNIFK